MKTNYNKMDAFVGLARLNGVNLRVNAYQSVKTDVFLPDYHEFWEGYRRLFSEGLVISCSEPVVRAVMGFEQVQSPCGHRSIRFNPRGQILPCVYWSSDPDPLPTLEDLFQMGAGIVESNSFQLARQLPARAAFCLCQGGCASRRSLTGDLDTHDYYCPWRRGENIELNWKAGPGKDLMRAGNVCTTIVA